MVGSLTSAEPDPLDQAGACVLDRGSNDLAICLWRTDYDASLVLAQQALERGQRPYFVRTVKCPYPTNPQWQQICTFGTGIVTVADEIGVDGVAPARIVDAMREALRDREVQRTAQAATPRTPPGPGAPTTRAALQRSPEERAELLSAFYGSATDEGLR